MAENRSSASVTVEGRNSLVGDGDLGRGFIEGNSATDFVDDGGTITVPDWSSSPTQISIEPALIYLVSTSNKHKVSAGGAVDLDAVTDSGVNYIYLQVYSDNTAEWVVNDTGTAPSEPSVKVGEVDTSAETITQTNQFPGFKSKSLDTEHTHTKSAESVYRVFKQAGTFYADGPNGIVGGGSDFATVMQAAFDDASHGDSLVVNQSDGDQWIVSQRMTIDVPMHILGRFTSLKLADGVDDHMFVWNVPDDETTFDPTRRPSRFSGFWADGNDVNNAEPSTFLRFEGSSTGTVINNNVVKRFRGGQNTAGVEASVFDVSSNSDAHVLFIHSNHSESNSHRFLNLFSGYNFVQGNDAGGGIKSYAPGTNIISGNIIYGALQHNGVDLYKRDILSNNLIIDNEYNGVAIKDGTHDSIVSNNIVMNNSDGSKDYYVGIEAGAGGTIERVTITNNQTWYRDPSLSGSGDGAQKYGIKFRGSLVDCIVKNNNFLKNRTAPFTTDGAAFNNTVLRDNLGISPGDLGAGVVIDGKAEASLSGAPDATAYPEGVVVEDTANAGDLYYIYDNSTSSGATQIGT